MDVLREILLVFLWNIIVPFLTGLLFTKYFKADNRESIAKNFILGEVITLGVFQPVTLASIAFKVHFRSFSRVMGALLIILCIVSLFLNFNRIKTMLSQGIRLKRVNGFMLLALVLIGFQIYMYMAYQHIDDDDAFFVAMAGTCIESDTLYKFNPYTGRIYNSLPSRYIMSPFAVYYAFMSYVTGIHYAVYAHTYLPAVLVLVSYLVYYLWGRALFDKKDSYWKFLSLVSIINIFGNNTSSTAQAVMLIRIWQGKAFLAAALIPFIIYECFLIKRDGFSLSRGIILFVTASAAGLVSSMGIFFAPMVIGVWALVDLILSKRPRNVIYYGLCSVPSIIYGLGYLLIK